LPASAEGGGTDSLRPRSLRALHFRPDCQNTVRRAPGRTRWRRAEKTKNPATFRARGFSTLMLLVQFMATPRAPSALPRPHNPGTNSFVRGCRPRRTGNTTLPPGWTWSRVVLGFSGGPRSSWNSQSPSPA